MRYRYFFKDGHIIECKKMSAEDLAAAEAAFGQCVKVEKVQ